MLESGARFPPLVEIRDGPECRVIYCRQGLSRLYFDPRTSEVIDAIEPGSRQFRWWHLALHRLDLPGLGARPLWDLVMLPLLTGTVLVCALGAWMGWRRLRGVGPGHA